MYYDTRTCVLRAELYFPDCIAILQSTYLESMILYELPSIHPFGAEARPTPGNHIDLFG